jgi:hypothetical protein
MVSAWLSLQAGQVIVAVTTNKYPIRHFEVEPLAEALSARPRISAVSSRQRRVSTGPVSSRLSPANALVFPAGCSRRFRPSVRQAGNASIFLHAWLPQSPPYGGTPNVARFSAGSFAGFPRSSKRKSPDPRSGSAAGAGLGPPMPEREDAVKMCPADLPCANHNT